MPGSGHSQHRILLGRVAEWQLLNSHLPVRILSRSRCRGFSAPRGRDVERGARGKWRPRDAQGDTVKDEMRRWLGRSCRLDGVRNRRGRRCSPRSPLQPSRPRAGLDAKGAPFRRIATHIRGRGYRRLWSRSGAVRRPLRLRYIFAVQTSPRSPASAPRTHRRGAWSEHTTHVPAGPFRTSVRQPAVAGPLGSFPVFSRSTHARNSHPNGLA